MEEDEELETGGEEGEKRNAQGVLVEKLNKYLYLVLNGRMTVEWILDKERDGRACAEFVSLTGTSSGPC
jgi:hypothetical protein